MCWRYKCSREQRHTYKRYACKTLAGYHTVFPFLAYRLPPLVSGQAVCVCGGGGACARGAGAAESEGVLARGVLARRLQAIMYFPLLAYFILPLLVGGHAVWGACAGGASAAGSKGIRAGGMLAGCRKYVKLPWLRAFSAVNSASCQDWVWRCEFPGWHRYITQFVVGTAHLISCVCAFRC